MANTLGGFDILDAEFVRSLRPKDAEMIDLERANSLTVPSGATPAQGWFLLRRQDYLAINAYTAFSAVIQSELVNKQSAVVRDNSLALNGLYSVSARAAWRGSPADTTSPYLVQVADARWLLKNALGETPLGASYNVRAPAYDTQYNTYSLNSGTPWTWATMLQNIWTSMPLLGSWPGLPASYTPVGTPEGWQFPGTSAWDALCGVLGHLGLAVSCDLTQSANFYGIVHQGDADATFAAIQAAAIVANFQREDEGSAIPPAGVVPGSVIVYFHRRNQYYGTEETVRRDSSQWLSVTAYTVTVSTGYSSPQVGIHWDDFTVRYDENGNPLSADTVAAATKAASSVADYVSVVTRGGNGEMRQVYSGVRSFTTGSLVDAVTWKHGANGWTTEIVRDPWGRWLPGGEGISGPDRRPSDSANTQPPYFAPTYPNYPPHPQVVRAYGSAITASPYAGTLFAGYTEQVLTGTSVRDREACYILFPGAGTYVGRLSSQYNGSPLYIANGDGSPSGGTVFNGGTSGSSGTAPPGTLNLPTLTVNGPPAWTPTSGTYPVVAGPTNLLWWWNGTAWVPLGTGDWTYHQDKATTFYGDKSWHMAGVHTGSSINPSAFPLENNILYAVPFICPAGGVVSELGFGYEASGTTPHAIMGIYQQLSSSDKSPGALVYSTASLGVTIGAPNVVSFPSVGYALMPNVLYWIVLGMDEGLNIQVFDDVNFAGMETDVIGWGDGGSSGAFNPWPGVSIQTLGGGSPTWTYGALPNPWPAMPGWVVNFQQASPPQTLYVPCLGVKF